MEKLAHVRRRIYLALPEPLNVAYALCALAGLRTGEVLALRWRHVDLQARRIHVRESVNGPPGRHTFASQRSSAAGVTVAERCATVKSSSPHTRRPDANSLASSA